MCKLMIMSGITDETKDMAWALTKEMAKQMSAPHCSESDGVGYAAIGNDGNLFGERWLNNKDAFQHKNTYGAEITNDVLKKFKILSHDKVYGNFGVFNDNVRSITLHSRQSTNTKGYKNTHPFVEDFTSVVHNGVISNHEKFYKKTSTCDSEVILHQYLKLNVNNKPGKIKKLANKLEGYFALGIFSRTNEGRVILDVIKDNSAKLEAFFIKELNTVVFATPKYNTNPIEDACKTLGLTIVAKLEVKSNRLQRIDALTGETIGYESFKSKEYVKNYPTKYDSNGYDSDGVMFPYGNHSPGSVSDPRFDDVFSRHNPRGGNIIDMTTHSKSKHADVVKERYLEEMLMSNKEYTQEDIEKLVNGKGGVIESLEEVNKDFNDSGDTEWIEDDKLTWHKKTLA